MDTIRPSDLLHLLVPTFSLSDFIVQFRVYSIPVVLLIGSLLVERCAAVGSLWPTLGLVQAGNGFRVGNVLFGRDQLDSVDFLVELYLEVVGLLFFGL